MVLRKSYLYPVLQLDPTLGPILILHKIQCCAARILKWFKLRIYLFIQRVGFCCTYVSVVCRWISMPSISKSCTWNNSLECHSEIHVENCVDDRIQCWVHVSKPCDQIYNLKLELIVVMRQLIYSMWQDYWLWKPRLIYLINICCLQDITE